MQKGVWIILVWLGMAFTPATAQTNQVVKAADSLYNKKQYTQALDLYKSLLAEHKYSPSMFLKMAYIQEALGHLGESLYYLNLYYLASDDDQALKKMEELAKKNNLEGYETNETIKVLAWVQKEYSTIAITLAAICIFLTALMYYQRAQLKQRPVFIVIVLVVMLGMLFMLLNFSGKSDRVIVAHAPTYLMSGPSAGASVVAIIGEGHQLEINGSKDVWLRTKWKEKEVFVKEFSLRPVRL